MTDLAAQIRPLVTNAVLAMVGIAFCLAFLRLVLGPNLPDRAIAVDLMAVLVVGLMAGEALHTGQEVFLIAAVVLSLVMFLGTVAFALYIQRVLKR